MSIAALIISFIAVLISGLGYYKAHHHVSKKLFAFVSLSTSFFDRKELPIAILNAGNSDAVLLGCSVSMDFRSEHGHSLSRDSDKMVFEPSFKGLLNPGDATIATVHFHPTYEKNIMDNCGEPDEDGDLKVHYIFSISWCDSSGKKFRSEIPLAQLVIDESGNLCGFKEVENSEVNLYDYAK